MPTHLGLPRPQRLQGDFRALGAVALRTRGAAVLLWRGPPCGQQRPAARPSLRRHSVLLKEDRSVPGQRFRMKGPKPRPWGVRAPAPPVRAFPGPRQAAGQRSACWGVRPPQPVWPARHRPEELALSNYSAWHRNSLYTDSCLTTLENLPEHRLLANSVCTKSATH